MSFQEFHQSVNQVTPDEQMNVLRHDLQLNEFLPPSFKLLGQNNFEPFIYWRRQHRTSVFRTEHHMISADGDDVVVTAHVFHASSTSSR